MSLTITDDNYEQLLKIFFKKCKDDYKYFASKNLLIRGKDGIHQRFRLNAAQQLIHKKLEHQRKNKGKVRALIIKGRQQGVSTYVQGRFIWRLLHDYGLRAFILTHLSESTQALFSMTRRYVDHLPLYKPQLGKANQNEIYFSDIDCGYKVGTAGSKGVGRGETIQLFHGSEIGYWPQAEDHIAGILQAVPDEHSTEIILESTANGTGNMFHKMCYDAQANQNGFELIFVPWTLQKEYSIYNDDEFSPDEEEQDLIERYNLNIPQLKWRREKISQFGDPRKFRQEYPLALQEAFIADTDRAYISRAEVEIAADPNQVVVADKEAPIVIGIDPARYGGDETGYAIRCGRIVEEIGVLEKMDTMQLSGRIIRMIERYDPERVFIDLGSFGAAIYDRLREQGYKSVQGINFGERADDPERYGNKRAEMFARIKEWLANPPCKIPHDRNLMDELTSINFFENSSGKLMMESKENMRKRGIRSPNMADALALTFAVNITKHNIRSINTKTMSFNNNWNPYNF